MVVKQGRFCADGMILQFYQLITHVTLLFYQLKVYYTEENMYYTFLSIRLFMSVG